MPHLPTNLLVSEQDSVLAAVNDRLSQCAFDFVAKYPMTDYRNARSIFVAKYQFPIPLTQEYVPNFFGRNSFGVWEFPSVMRI